MTELDGGTCSKVFGLDVPLVAVPLAMTRGPKIEP